MKEEPTMGEMSVMFAAHERRDEERYQEGKESLKGALDDVSTAIQLASREIMNEVKNLSSAVEKLQKKVESLELSKAGRDGSSKVLTYIGMAVIGTLVTYLGWISLEVINLKTAVTALQEILSGYNITKQ